MQDVLGLIAFAALIAVQFLAVVRVRHDAHHNQESGQSARSRKEAPTWNTWLSA
jgi:hypothetical protein